MTMKYEHNLYSKVMLKYKIMRIRNKISYMAYKQGVTIRSFFIQQILKTFNTFRQEGSIKINE